MTFTGHTIAGEGLDGCSRETLDFLVAYNPDSALLLDCSVLFRGLKNGQWMSKSMSEVMLSALAVGAVGDSVNFETDVSRRLEQEESILAEALSVVPESKNFQLLRRLKGNLLEQLSEHRSLASPDVPEVALRMTRVSGFLYMVRRVKGSQSL